METREPNGSHKPGDTGTGLPKGSGAAISSLRERFAEAVRFWEPRRIVYNLILTAVVVIWILKTWPHFRPAFNLQGLLFLVVMALLANLCYCAAYLVDLPLLSSTQSAAWSQRWRWSVWVIGTFLAILFENYWIVDEVYPFVR